MPGPPPKAPGTAQRRNNPRAGFLTLPKAGRKGPPPPWPLAPDARRQAMLDYNEDQVASLTVELADADDGREKGRLRRALAKAEMTAATLKLQIEQADDLELALWAELWATPQATMWEKAHAGREVAQYVRWKIRAEQGEKIAGEEARHWSDRLGLNPLALLRLRMEIERVDEVETRGQQRRTASKPAPRSRKKPPDDPRSILRAV